MLFLNGRELSHLADYAAALDIIYDGIKTKQYKAEVGHLSIDAALCCMEETAGHLAKALSEIEHDEEMHPPPQLWCGQRMLTEAAE